MNILITGSNGFVAKEIIQRIEKNHPDWILYKTNRETLDVLSPKEVDKFFDRNEVDYVIHCAISGGRRTKPDGYDVVYNNSLMFENLVKHSDKYENMIIFGSGAETERTLGVDSFTEKDFKHGKNIPIDYYGFSKYMVAKRAEDLSKIINLRIFNVFGEFEANDRMVKNNINNYLSGSPLEIYQNRFMDFFGANDLYKVIEHLIINPDVYRFTSFNMCYEDKHTLVDVANIINDLSDTKSEIKIVEEGMSPPYCGSAERLSTLGLEFDGLEKSIKEVYNIWKQ